MLRRIKFLESTFGNSANDTARIVEETEDGIYYFDSFNRWCYIPKSEEGVCFSHIPDKKCKGEATCHDAL